MSKGALFLTGSFFSLLMLVAAMTPARAEEATRAPASDSDSEEVRLENQEQAGISVGSGLMTVQAKDRLLIHWADGSAKKEKRSFELRLVNPSTASNVSKDSNTYRARIVRGKGQLQFTRDADVVRVEILGAAPQKSGGSIEVEVTDPGVPVSIAIEEGAVTAKDFKSALTVLLGKGKFVGLNGQGEAKVSIREGAIGFDGWKANVVADLFSGTLDLKDLEGRAKLRNFLGKTSLAGFTGPLQFETFKGPLNISSSKGSIDFKSQSGSVQVVDYDGDVHGSTESGAVTLRLKGRVNSRIDSNVGSLSVSVPSSAGARVYVASDEGRLTVPRAVGNLPNGAKSLSGRMGGDGAGFLSLRSKAGDIKLSVY